MLELCHNQHVSRALLDDGSMTDRQSLLTLLPPTSRSPGEAAAQESAGAAAFYWAEHNFAGAASPLITVGGGGGGRGEGCSTSSWVAPAAAGADHGYLSRRKRLCFVGHWCQNTAVFITRR